MTFSRFFLASALFVIGCGLEPEPPKVNPLDCVDYPGLKNDLGVSNPRFLDDVTLPSDIQVHPSFAGYVFDTAIDNPGMVLKPSGAPVIVFSKLRQSYASHNEVALRTLQTSGVTCIGKTTPNNRGLYSISLAPGEYSLLILENDRLIIPNERLTNDSPPIDGYLFATEVTASAPTKLTILK